LIEHFKLLLQLWVRPAHAMGAILDRGSLLFASIAAAAAGVAVVAATPLRVPFYMPLLVLAVVYVPGLLLAVAVIGRLTGLAVSFARDYGPVLACVSMAWSAAQIPVILAGYTTPPEVFPVIFAAAHLYFAVLVFFAVRTVFGAGNGAAAGIVLASSVPPLGALLLAAPLLFFLRLLASPFFLFFLIYYLGSEFGRLGESLRRQQHFSRMMQAAAVNPHDGEAQYQLGLIHQQRRQYTEAIRRFQNAAAIDPTETDAHFQLGRIARHQGRPQDALNHLLTVAAQDDKHSLSEIHRELGAAYLEVGRASDAARELEIYTDRREYDPEGLYYYGRALDALDRGEDARERYRRAVEAARTAPRYRRPLVARWSRLAQKELRR
jgi:tetratricopeptide (TPR) repeat protein